MDQVAKCDGQIDNKHQMIRKASSDDYCKKTVQRLELKKGHIVLQLLVGRSVCRPSVFRSISFDPFTWSIPNLVQVKVKPLFWAHCVVHFKLYILIPCLLTLDRFCFYREDTLEFCTMGAYMFLKHFLFQIDMLPLYYGTMFLIFMHGHCKDIYSERICADYSSQVDS